jgi:hypothetical protein
MTAIHLKARIELTSEVWCILNMPHTIGNIEQHFSVMNGPITIVLQALSSNYIG